MVGFKDWSWEGGGEMTLYKTKSYMSLLLSKQVAQQLSDLRKC